MIEQYMEVRTARRMIRGFSYCTWLLAAACAMEVEPAVEAEGTESALNGTIEFVGCDLYETNQANWAVQFIKSRTVDRWDLQNCLLNGVTSGETPSDNPMPTDNNPNGYPYVEELIRRLRTNIPTRIECVSTGNNNAAPETVILDHGAFVKGKYPASLTDDERAGLVAVVAHELTHTKGTGHPGEWCEAGKCVPPSVPNREHDYAWPNVVGTCLGSLSHPSRPDRPFGRVRYDEIAASGEVTLAPVGMSAGDARAPLSCSTDRFAFGLQGRAGSAIDALGLSCRDLNNSTQNPGTQGGTGGTPFTLNCPSGRALMGVWGQAGNFIEGIGPICGDVNQILAGQYSDFGDSAAAGSVGTNYFRRWCPGGQVVKGLRLRTGSLVNRVEVVCQKLASLRSLPTLSSTTIGGTGGSHRRLEMCPSRSAIEGLLVNANPSLTSGVGRISGLCRPVSNSSQNSPITIVSSEPHHFLAGQGGPALGPGWQQTEDFCSGRLLTGLSVKTDGYIRQIRGQCRGTDWSTSNWTASIPSYTPWRGLNQGTETSASCPANQYLVGWTAKMGTMIDSIQIACRRF